MERKIEKTIAKTRDAKGRFVKAAGKPHTHTIESSGCGGCQCKDCPECEATEWAKLYGRTMETFACEIERIADALLKMQCFCVASRNSVRKGAVGAASKDSGKPKTRRGEGKR